MEVHYFGNPNANIILIQMVDNHDLSLMKQEMTHILSMTDNADFLLVAFQVDDWNKDLSPWSAPAVFGNEAFGGFAGDTLSALTDWIAAFRKDHVGGSLKFYLGGYSLAGLFALWTAYQTDLFYGIAAASPSVWFPGFREYVKSHELRTRSVYLSLGDREEKTKNPVMAEVGNAIRGIHELLQEKNIPCTLEWNAGNHFKEPDLRTAKGFAWLMHLQCTEYPLFTSSCPCTTTSS